MMARLSDGVPSTGVYLTSPSFSLAAALKMALMGVLFFGSPIPRWMTGSPFSRRMRASSFSASVGEAWIARASWLSVMDAWTSTAKSQRRRGSDAARTPIIAPCRGPPSPLPRRRGPSDSRFAALRGGRPSARLAPSAAPARIPAIRRDRLGGDRVRPKRRAPQVDALLVVRDFRDRLRRHHRLHRVVHQPGLVDGDQGGLPDLGDHRRGLHHLVRRLQPVA